MKICKKNKEEKMEYAPTSPNRTVYASPPNGGSGSVRLGHSAALHSHASLRHILPALAFAAQSPYPGWQNVIYRRNVMCNALEIIQKILTK
jgi:ABC-type uncharacterized transport system YnjBCD substrate-binding protein